jgi:hypothetical protein
VHGTLPLKEGPHRRAALVSLPPEVARKRIRRTVAWTSHEPGVRSLQQQWPEARTPVASAHVNSAPTLGRALFILGSPLWQNQTELYRLKYASPLPRAPTCFKRYNPLACRVTSR